MKKYIIVFLFFFSASVFADTLTPAKKAFINQLVTKNHFNRAQLNALFRSLHKDPAVIARMTKPFEGKPWPFYRNYFVTPERISLGAKYLKVHHHELMQLQEKYGIPASVIVAIIGVETQYGTHLGEFSILRALYTLGFYYPPREKFFRKELAEYLILTRDNHLPIKIGRAS